MLWGSSGGVREENGEFSVYVRAEGFEGFDGVERWLERNLLVGDKVVKQCHVISSTDVFVLREALEGRIREAEVGREAAGEVGIEDPSVEFVDCVDGDRVTCYNVTLLGGDEASTEFDFGGVGFVHGDKVGKGGGLETC